MQPEQVKIFWDTLKPWKTQQKDKVNEQTIKQIDVTQILTQQFFSQEVEYLLQAKNEQGERLKHQITRASISERSVKRDSMGRVVKKHCIYERSVGQERK